MFAHQIRPPAQSIFSHLRLACLFGLMGLATLAIHSSVAVAQDGNGTTVIGVNQNAVGGVSINAEGVLSFASVDGRGRLAEMRRDAREALGEDIAAVSALRKVSLRRLEQAIVERGKAHEPVSEAMRLLAGLQRVEFVFVYPDEQDIVIAGPAEGWQQDAAGNIVGQQSGRAVLKLEDLVVALRAMRAAPGTSFSCSIDPTQEGMQRLRQLMSSGQIKQMSRQAVAAIENALGPQMIRVGGVPDSSHFAQVMVAADYRMKRLAMNLDKSPVKGLTSYLHLASARGSMTPRWWLAPNYESIEKDADGLAWQFSGQGVKAMAEEDFFSASGVRQRSAKASAAAQHWADQMTASYDELALAEPIFAELQGCMDLALVAALVTSEGLAAKANCPLTYFMNAKKAGVGEWPAPRQVDTEASVMKKGRNWIISASGGVQMNTWELVSAAKESTAIGESRDEAATGSAVNRWWWD